MHHLNESYGYDTTSCLVDREPTPAGQPAGRLRLYDDVIRINPPAPPARACPHTGRHQPAGEPRAASSLTVTAGLTHSTART